MKQVDYWAARVHGDDDVAGYVRNDEIDDVEWVPWAEAERRLSYDHDRRTLAQARPLRRRTQALVVLRHAQALARGSWDGDDRRRPLVPAGEAEAERLVAILEAFGVRQLHSSSSVRCVATVSPFVHATGWPLRSYDELSEEGVDAGTIEDLVRELMTGAAGAVVCTHRTVIPSLLEPIALAQDEFAPAEMLVVHHRKGAVVASERIRP